MEFGRVIVRVSGQVTEEIRQRVIEDMEATRAFRFPRWRGVSDVLVHNEALGRFVSVGWYADVPDEYVTDEGIEVLHRKDRQIADLRTRVAELETLLEERQSRPSGPVVLSCGECDEEIPVPIVIEVRDGNLVADPDLSGVWLHSWTHREEEKT